MQQVKLDLQTASNLLLSPSACFVIVLVNSKVIHAFGSVRATWTRLEKNTHPASSCCSNIASSKMVLIMLSKHWNSRAVHRTKGVTHAVSCARSRLMFSGWSCRTEPQVAHSVGRPALSNYRSGEAPAVQWESARLCLSLLTGRPAAPIDAVVLFAGARCRWFSVQPRRPLERAHLPRDADTPPAWRSLYIGDGRPCSTTAPNN